MDSAAEKRKIKLLKEAIDKLSNISERMLGNENLQTTAEAILETLTLHLNAFGGGIYFIDEKGKDLYLFSYSNTRQIDKAIQALGDIFRFKLPLDSDILISQCIRENKLVESEYLRDFFSPVVPKMPLNIIQKATKLKLCIGVPIRLKGKPIGVLFGVFQKKKLSATDLSFLHFYTNLSGLAIDNNRKYLELESKYEQEKTTTSMLSHELKTPIAIAHNSSQLLKRYVQGREHQLGDMVAEFTNLHEEIDTSVKRLNYICGSIFNLIDSEDKDTDVLHKLDLEKQLEQVFDIYRRKTEAKGLDFSYDLQVAPGTFYGGGVQFEQVITILLDNAVKYTRKGGINLKVVMDEDKMCCKVTDTGPGIPKSKREAIFGRFYRHKSLANRNLKDIEGLGLGLYVAKRLTQKLGGTIEAYDNSIERGTQFIVEMPVYSEMPQD